MFSTRETRTLPLVNGRGARDAVAEGEVVVDADCVTLTVTERDDDDVEVATGGTQ
jgi:hypothetical protein